MSHRTYKVFRHTLAALLIAGAMSTSAIAQTTFFSVHQWEQNGIAGWKNLFPPDHNGNGYSWRSPEIQTNLSTFKIFIPKGTTFAYAGGYFPQSVKYAVVTRIGQPPTRTSMVSLGEYAQLTGENSNPNTMFAKMLAGQEITTVHDGGGAKSLTGLVRYQQTPFDKSVWVYGRVLQVEGETPYPIDTLRGQYEFDSNIYSNWFGSTSFSSNGDPLEEIGSNTPSSGSTPTPPSTTRLTTTESVDASGNLNLNFTFASQPADQGKAASVFVLAQTPRNGMFIKTSSGWKELSAFDLAFVTSPIFLDSVKFTSIPSLQASNPLTLSTGLPRSALKDNSVRFYTGYRVDGGALVSLGVLW